MSASARIFWAKIFCWSEIIFFEYNFHELHLSFSVTGQNLLFLELIQLRFHWKHKLISIMQHGLKLYLLRLLFCYCSHFDFSTEYCE